MVDCYDEMFNPEGSIVHQNKKALKARNKLIAHHERNEEKRKDKESEVKKDEQNT